MVWRIGYLAALLSALGVSGCGGKAAAPPHGGSAGSAASGGSGGRGSVPAECSALEDDAGWSMIVQISNQTMAPIHLGSQQNDCGDVAPFVVAPENGKPLTITGRCIASCGALMKGDVFGCPLICIPPASITLQPGEVTRIPWSGTYLSTATLPAKCLPEGQQLDQCSKWQRVQPGKFLFAVLAGTELDCSQTTGGPCQACQPLETGGCSTQASLIAGAALRAENWVTLDPGYGVGEGGPSGEPLPIELVFH